MRKRFELLPSGGVSIRVSATNVRETPASGLIAAFTDDSLFLKRAEITPAAELPPDHGFIELYTHRGRPASTDLYELEMHGRYTEIGPGASLSFEEQWELHPYDGPETPAAHVNLLKALLERDASTMSPTLAEP